MRSSDFRGINHLASRLGDDLLVGVILDTGQATFSFGPRNIAVPISAIREPGG
jgi:hypothetical protein